MEPTTINWYRSPIEKETLRQLTLRSDLKGWLQAGSFLLSWLYWWMNYHTEHHMFAAVPFFNLKKLRKVVDVDMPPARTGLFPCLRLLFEVKRKQETDPRYFCVPDLPSTAAPLKRV